MESPAVRCLALLCIALLTSAQVSLTGTASLTGSAALVVPPPIILSTDWGTDPDDDADLWIVTTLHLQARVTLLGVISSSDVTTSAPGIRACLDFRGLQSVPVGAYLGNYSPAIPNNYATAVRDAFRPGDVRTNYPSSTVQYRTLLAASRGGVIIIAVGPSKDLSDLLDSPADGISGLTGSQLIAAKVALLVWAAGVWPTDTGAPAGYSPEYNLSVGGSAPSARNVIDNWPTPIHSVGIELAGTAATGGGASQPANTIASGFGPPPHGDASTNPFTKAWDVNAFNEYDSAGLRTAWGNLAVLYGAEGATSLFSVAGANGTATVNSATNNPITGPAGHNTWTATAGTRTYLGLQASRATIQSYLATFFQ